MDDTRRVFLTAAGAAALAAPLPAATSTTTPAASTTPVPSTTNPADNNKDPLAALQARVAAIEKQNAEIEAENQMFIRMSKSARKLYAAMDVPTRKAYLAASAEIRGGMLYIATRDSLKAKIEIYQKLLATYQQNPPVPPVNLRVVDVADDTV
jgi:hypothetical protein